MSAEVIWCLIFSYYYHILIEWGTFFEKNYKYLHMRTVHRICCYHLNHFQEEKKYIYGIGQKRYKINRKHT